MYGSQPVGSRVTGIMGPEAAVNRRNGAADMGTVVGEK
jgi:hypothetical protein